MIGDRRQLNNKPGSENSLHPVPFFVEVCLLKEAEELVVDILFVSATLYYCAVHGSSNICWDLICSTDQNLVKYVRIYRKNGNR